MTMPTYLKGCVIDIGFKYYVKHKHVQYHFEVEGLTITMADINNLILLMSKIQGELDETKRKLKQEEAEKERALTR